MLTKIGQLDITGKNFKQELDRIMKPNSNIKEVESAKA
jgi:hypothetical protein